jgi:hypothetical protein
MSEPIIRLATIRDADRVAELSGTLGYPVSAETMRERLARFLALDAHTIVVASNRNFWNWDPAARSWGWSLQMPSAGAGSVVAWSKQSSNGDLVAVSPKFSSGATLCVRNRIPFTSESVTCDTKPSTPIASASADHWSLSLSLAALVIAG